MTAPIGVAATPPPGSDRAKLLAAAQSLEAVFLQQMLQAMRDATPEGGLIEQSAGERIFRGVLDETMALEAVKQNERGLAASLYQQLSRHLPPEGATAVVNPGTLEAPDGAGN